MIVVDTSALIAIVKNEIGAFDCQEVLTRESKVLLNAATLTEALIVARGKKCLAGLTNLIDRLPITIIELDVVRAERAAAAYALFGKGFHKASLNFGDCFAYATAKEFNCPLLYVGQDFARTDVVSAIATPSA
ncbi:Probable ribonuclease VapC 4 [Neorhizobium galegae bv. officinalis bv. officinalis str. HAMBI 1141]|uniref:Ribonuclease VapC n=1 Tax=Neorhizobium galegae bv. officinalis bv. officinalis str. HAMBI 1141 TaxID=1028801 RepID=A0A068TDJ9_NEOGA|nr:MULTISPECIES: type II toxin-antitoxin system VapC family toxin [Neorhizobium]MCJ9673669.1 type II toxin-antitoxin system VapC family toxin [Neorhizobium sp. SHOUNA12B]MCJ9744871.1 type II toxin-antitoxin system VapC family toxin [Neorhizobium sp. SHOUNA12A]MCJ9750180.1 type II toxin-antitoxin system VapC family toxin [Neorhizobium sp. BETTINA12A]CDN55415.1 Probable ribonuclease VapC 4 [Neorhizobium galegae bv. officinalis bv. officinalis str. HAMBI 1141]